MNYRRALKPKAIKMQKTAAQEKNKEIKRGRCRNEERI